MGREWQQLYWRAGVNGAELRTGALLDWSRVCDLERRWIDASSEQRNNETHPVSQETVHAEAGSRGEVYTLRVAGMEPIAPR